MIDTSFVIPVYNEGENISALYQSLSEVARTLSRSYEIVFVDDGSTDGTPSALASLYQTDAQVRVVTLKRNFGQTAALMAGLDHAQGEIVITLDGDLQNDPRDVPQLLAKLEEGFDVVSGWRKLRRDPFWSRRLPSWCANRLISWVTGVRLRDYGCTLKVYRRSVLEGIELYGEMHRFLPALVAWSGARVAEIPVTHHPRRFGISKYGMGRVLTVVLDLMAVKFLLSYRARPIQLFGTIGFLSALFGCVLFATVVVMKFARSYDITGNPLFLLSILSMLIGVQFIALGFLAELVTRVYYGSRERKTYVVKEIKHGSHATR